MSRMIAAVFLTVFVSLTAPASAHVRIVGNTNVTGGARVRIVLRCPTERNSATTSLAVQLPAGIDPSVVRVPGVAGWHATKSGDVVTWEGGSIPPESSGYFTLDVPLPHGPRDLPFKAVQTYADGTVVRWIELSDPGEPAPAYPAPVLHVH